MMTTAFIIFYCWVRASSQFPPSGQAAAPITVPAQSAPAVSFHRSALGNKKFGQVSASPLAVSRSHAYVAGISIGTPPQPLNCLIDTGSSDLWVPSMRCQDCATEHSFVAKNSRTFLADIEQTPQGLRPVSVDITYGSGEVVGYLVKDTVTFGQSMVPNQTFIIVEDAALPDRRSWDGICGLGWKELGSQRDDSTPLYKHLQQRGLVPIFTLVPGPNNQAAIVVGDVPSAVYQPNTLAWAPAEAVGPGEDRSFWVVTGGLSISNPQPTQVRFLVDTGSSFILAPPQLFKNVVHSMFTEAAFNEKCGVDEGGGGLVVCDCSIRQLPGVFPLKIHLGGNVYEVDVPHLFKIVEAMDGGELCLLQIQPNPMTEPIMEDPFSSLMGPFGFPLPVPMAPMSPGGASPSTSAEDPTENSFPFPFPFPLPRFGDPTLGGAGQPAGMPFSMPMSMPNPGSVGVGEEVQTTMERGPDGSMCETVKVYRNGQLTKTTSKCKRRRRLQAIATPPIDDLWILGATFLQHYVVAFDFVQARVGVAMPSANAAVSALSQLNAMPVSSVSKISEVADSRGAVQLAGAIACGMLLAISCAFLYSRLLRNGASSALDEERTRDEQFLPGAE